MRDFGRVRTSFWTDDKVIAASDRTKLLALYLMTGPHSNLVGCFRLPLGYVSADLGWPAETVSEGFRELFGMGFCDRCETTGWTLVRHFLRHNAIENPNVGKKAMAFIEAVPRTIQFYTRFLNELERHEDKFPNGYVNGLRNGIEQVSGTESQAKPEPEPSQPRAKPSKGGEPSAEAPARKAALEIIDAFDAIRVHLWGEARKRPMPAASDMEIARTWLAAGVAFDPLRDLFEAKMRAMSRAGREPPGTLKYFADSVAEMLGKRAA